MASWTAAGSPKQCIEHLNVYARMGIHTVGLRCTSWDQMGQLHRVIDEVRRASMAGARCTRPPAREPEGKVPATNLMRVES